MEQNFNEKAKEAVWIAKSLFERNKTSGSSANLSFFHEGHVYITESGTCFGTLKPDQFVPLSMDGKILSHHRPSKEWPLHLQLYQKKRDIGAVIHTHSTYCVLWSFQDHLDRKDCIPEYTPYLKMKLGTVGMVPYEAPGSPELFQRFGEYIEKSDGYLLERHGPVIAGKSLWDAFYCLEELEESAKIAWMLNQTRIQ